MKPVTAFGVRLTPYANGEAFEGYVDGTGAVRCWKEGQGWCAQINISDIVVSETIGSASPHAALRSLRGRVGNLGLTLAKLGIVDRKPPSLKRRRVKS